MSYPQYGVYLIPPPVVAYPLGVGHALMSSQYGAATGGRFMVHCTLKGFFKLADGADVADFEPALAELMARTTAFETRFADLWRTPEAASVPGFTLWLERTAGLHQLHNDIWEIVRPFIAPDCLFSPGEGAGLTFAPHLTLAMVDLPTDPGLLEQAFGLGEYIVEQLPHRKFVGRDIQLIEFWSDDWAGRWWETLSYKQLKGWRLAEVPIENEGDE